MKRIAIVLALTLLLLTMGACGGQNSEPSPNESESPPEDSEIEPEPSPAKFELQSLDVFPSEVTTGEVVNIEVVVANVGGAEGIYTAMLTVDGVTAETKDVAVAPSGSETIAFSIVKDEAGTYEIGIEALTSTLVVEEAVATIEISSDPDPIVPCLAEGGKFTSWTLVFTETNGVGVKLQSVEITFYPADGEPYSHTFESSDYLPPYGQLSDSAGCPCNIAYEVIIVIGIDDNGHEIRSERMIPTNPSLHQ